MYDELREAWVREVENVELQRLDPGFYSKVADYLRRLREERRMLDKRTMKSRLLKEEVCKVRKMVSELVHVRCKKSIKGAFAPEGLPTELWTEEEQRIFRLLPISEAYKSFAKGLLRGQIQIEIAPKERHNLPLRFLEAVPEIIGADMKTYGPFKSEDIASVPTENAKILVREGLAEEIESP